MNDQQCGCGAEGMPFAEVDKANRARLLRLEEKGVLFPQGSEGIFVHHLVDLDRIEGGVSLYPGCRLLGRKTLIRAGSRIGVTGPCVVNNMVLGRDVTLGSGSFEESVLLDGVKLGSAIRVRENCLLEEGAEAAFSVDVKHTFLMANVVLGSEINFCDVFMSGGTSRKDHSEIGSGVIHYNFTPFGKSGDKATASLLGDVVHGAFYRSKRIFIGGHTSLIGPVKVGFGSVVAADARLATDVEENTLFFGSRGIHGKHKDFDFLRYKSISRKVGNSIEYVAQLAALWHWYDRARRVVAADGLDEVMLQAALDVIAGGIAVRLDRLDTLRDNMEPSIEINGKLNEEGLVHQQETFYKQWPNVREKLDGYSELAGDEAARDRFMTALSGAAGAHGGDFLGLITQGLDDGAVEKGTRWLQSLVDEFTAHTSGLVPEMGN